MSNTYRIYSFTRGSTSWVNVGQGLVDGLTANGVEAKLFPLDDLGHELHGALTEGYDADIGVLVGPPAMASVMTAHGAHLERLVMIAPNSSWLPRDVFQSHEMYESVDGYLSPSTWGVKILEGYTERPVRLWHHGFDPKVFCPHEAKTAPVFRRPEERTTFEVLHLASTHFQRKGTKELIWAWVTAWHRELIPASCRLTLVCDGPPGYFESTICDAFEEIVGSTERKEIIRLHGRMNLPPEVAAHGYLEHDFICQPSRAEGFGLVPLEARACGVPAIMTTCTGHFDHANFASTIAVATGEEAPIDDGPDAMAPTLAVEDVVDALARAAEKPRVLDVDASIDRLREHFTWEAVTQRYLAQTVPAKEET